MSNNLSAASSMYQVDMIPVPSVTGVHFHNSIGYLWILSHHDFKLFFIQSCSFEVFK